MMYHCIVLQLIINFHLYLVYFPSEYDKYDHEMKQSRKTIWLLLGSSYMETHSTSTLFIFLLLCWFLLWVIVYVLTTAFWLSYESSAHCWIQLNDNLLLWSEQSFYECLQSAAFTWSSRQAFSLRTTKGIYNFASGKDSFHACLISLCICAHVLSYNSKLQQPKRNQTHR